MNAERASVGCGESAGAIAAVVMRRLPSRQLTWTADWRPPLLEPVAALGRRHSGYGS
jgi:hypothetical protein